MLNYCLENPSISKRYQLLLAGLIFFNFLLVGLVYEYWIAGMIHTCLFPESTFLSHLIHIMFYMCLAAAGTVFPFWLIVNAIKELFKRKAILRNQGRFLKLEADIGHLLTEKTKLSEFLQGTAEAIISNMDAQFARIWLLDKETNALKLFASAGMSGVYSCLNEPRSLISLDGPGEITKIANERKPHLTNCFAADPLIIDPEWAKSEGIAAFGGYPLTLEERLIGVMAVLASEPLPKEAFDALAPVAAKIAIGAEYKLSEESLRESEEKFRGVFEDSGAGMVIGSLGGRLLRVNEAFCNMVGYSREELLNKTIQEIIHHDDLEDTLEKAKLIFHGELDSFHVEKRYIHKLGHVVWASLNISIVRSAELEPLYMVAQMQNITDRKRAENELRKTNRMLKMLNDCNEALLRSRYEWELLDFICENIVRLGGYRMAWVGYAEHDKEKTVRPVAQFGFEAGYIKTLDATWADSERGRAPSGAAIRTGAICVVEDISRNKQFAPWRREAEKRGYTSLISIPLNSGPNTIGSLNIYSHEIDSFNGKERLLLKRLADNLAYGIVALRGREDQKRVKEALQNVATGFPSVTGGEFFRAITVHLLKTLDMDYAIIGKLEGSAKDEVRIIAMNNKKRFHNIYKYDLENTLFEKVIVSGLCCYPSRVRERFSEDAMLKEMGAEGCAGTPLVSRAGGPLGIIVLVSRKPVKNEHIVLSTLQVFAERVSTELERAHAEEELRIAYENLELRVAERTTDLKAANLELEEFNYIISHDLKEPLRTLSYYCDLLKRHVGDELSPAANKFIEFIQDASKRMKNLVHDLSELSGAGRKEIEARAVDLNDCISDVTKNLETNIDESGGVVEWDTLPIVYGDRTQLTLLLQNLVDNALKFRKKTPPRVTVSSCRVNGSWQVTVADNGIGIDNRFVGQIFEPFKRLHSREKYQGTGIGLSICRKIIDRCGGTLTVASSPGAGSKFKFTLNADPVTLMKGD